MFGIGTPELLVILIVALIVVGPQRLPELGRTVGRALREFRKVQDEVRGMVRTEIGSDLDDVRNELRGTANELRRSGQEITGGVRDATDVQSLLPKTKRGPHRTRRPGAMLRGSSGATAPAPPETTTAPDTGAEQPETEPDTPSDSGSTSAG
jgi:Tat protein translocase TatB subunit